MKWTAVIFVALAVALSFWLGHATAPALESELASVASFRRSLEDPDWLTRSYRFSSFLMGLNPENLPDALEALEPHLSWLNTDEFRLFMLAWARFDPIGAFEHAQSWPLEIRRKAGAAAMYAWGFYGPLEAVRELSAIENTEFRAFWGERLLAGWVHGEYRDSANEYIAAFPEGPTRRKYLETLAWEIAKQGPEAVMRWAEDVPEDPPHFKQAVLFNPKYGDVYNYLGVAQVESGSLQEGVEAFRRAVKVSPDSLVAQLNLGFALALLGQNREAEEQLRIVLDREPRNEAALSLLEEIACGDWSARTDADKMIRHDVRNDRP